MTHDEIMALDAEYLRREILLRRPSAIWTIGADGLHFYPPNWPADIRAAWELVDEMREQSACVQIENGWGDQDWLVRITIEGSYRYVGGETAPIAICRAYLMWKQG